MTGGSWKGWVLTLAALVFLGAPSAARAIEPLGSFGTPGVGAGQFSGPQGITVDGAGTISVASSAGVRVDRWDSNGNFINAYGYDVIPGGGAGFEVCTAATTCKAGLAGGGPGQLNGPFGIATTPSGDRLAVTEITNQRVSFFDATPSFAEGWGYDTIPGGAAGFEICTNATGCQVAISGIAQGQFGTPTDATWLASGNLLVSSAFGVLQEFTPQGEYVRGFGFPGPGPGALSTPYSTAEAPSGDLFIADANNARLDIFSAGGGFKRAVGRDVIPGAPAEFEACTPQTNCQGGAVTGDAGSLGAPSGVGIGPGGEVYVSEQITHRVSQFTTEGQFVQAFGFDVIPGGGTGFEVCTAATTCKAGVSGAGVGQFATPLGVAVDCRGTVYVSDSLNGRINIYGEPGARKPPCPSNAFTFGKLERNKRKGTAILPVTLPGPGALSLAGTNLKPASFAPSVAGELDLPIKPKGKAKRKLKRKGKAKVTPAVTFTPTNGDPNAQSQTVKLKRKDGGR